MVDYENTQEISAYNEAGLQISRLHEMWLMADAYARRGKLKRWKFILDCIYRELYSDIIKRDEKRKWIYRNKKLLLLIANATSYNFLYFHLDERHRFLKSIQDTVGKGGIYKDADDESTE